MKTLLRWLHRLEDGLLVIILGSMVLLAVVQILLRNMLGIGLVWADPLLHNAVLWIGLVGAMIAARQDSHIRIDLLPRVLAGTPRRVLAIIGYLATSAICALVAWHSLGYVIDEAAMPIMVFARVPSWWLQTVIPVGFAVMALRYGALAAGSLLGEMPPTKTPKEIVS